MITDAQLRFSDAQAITVTTNSTNVIDLTTNADIARGLPLRFQTEVLTAFTAGGAATLQVQLVTSASPSLSSPTILRDSGAMALASLTAGTIIFDGVVPRTALRYIGVIYTVATGPMTAGTVFGGIVEDTETVLSDRLVGVTYLT